MFVYNKEFVMYLEKWNNYFIIQFKEQSIIKYVKDYQIMNNILEIK